jgi:creatinine amidohydrolase
MSAARPWIIAESNWKHIKDHPYEVAVLPWGATEAHNTHLPYATDSLQNEALCAEAGRLAWQSAARVAILPNVPFGVQTGQLDIPFCINMNPSTQMAVLSDVIASLQGVGVAKFVLFNGHGGNCFKQMLRELQPRHPAIHLSTVSWFQIDAGSDLFEVLGDHADERETSLMLHLHPQWVLPQDQWGEGGEKKPRLQAMQQRWAWAPRPWSRISPDTGTGDPRAATAEKGRAYFERLSQRFAQYLVELAKTSRDDLYQR